MKILVPVKRVPDPDQRIRLRDDGCGIDVEGTPYVMNPFDAIAVEEAVRIAERAEPGQCEIVAVGLGCDGLPDYEKQLREALAMGADRAIWVACGAELDPWNVASLLRVIVQREHPDLVLMGKQAIDDDSNQTGQFLAAILDWPQATFASQIDFEDRGVRVVRETDAGMETVHVGLPAVITTDLRLNEPRYASLPSVLKAKRKPLERIDATDLGIPIEPRIRLRQLRTTSTARDCTPIGSPKELVDRLRNEAKVI